MKEGITYKEKYNNLIKEIENVIKRKEKSVKLASEFLKNDDLMIGLYSVKDEIKKAMNENMSSMNTLNEILIIAEEWNKN
ncbi:MAG: hypothetical protein ACRC1T_05595 [Clostridium chrysemydis]|uniref:hypothetical protein n=1 Tax=Clostridium chrysemydis TaxID=2665504 RepID=UPI003F408BBB